MNPPKIGIAADHAGFRCKEELKVHLLNLGYEVVDFGVTSSDSVDYPDYAHPLSQAVNTGELVRGVLVCGSGQGVCMTANKYPQVRAALVWNEEVARLTRQHNNANIICIPGRLIQVEEALQALDAFLGTDFEGGRHERRIGKIPIH